ncbi:hypothetical protein [Shewanella cyperi]|uniref:hypothetical protein n=1 Tax=Shewanella cyperi TaxID=2814292 RepID=UPI001A942D51|nr:hypothetical protein [Shewanella cyperi]QSX41328.1 hypothetical protein JYB84_02515 [Shewanella cyperi]
MLRLSAALLLLYLPLVSAHSLTIQQPELQLDLSCDKPTQELALKFTVPKVYAFSRDKSCLIFLNQKQVIAQLDGLASIGRFTATTNMDWLQRLLTSELDNISLEAVSFRSGNSIESTLNLAPIRSQLSEFAKQCQL